MKVSIRTKFTLGMIFFFVIIAGITLLSAYHLSKLSHKTDAILKENHFSVIFARDMAEELTVMNQEITRCFANNSEIDTSVINTASASFKKSLLLEMNNITEPGEDKLASGIQSAYNEYISYILACEKKPVPSDVINTATNKFRALYQQTMLLSQMNEQAIILKANDTKKSAENGLASVSLLGTICFIITLSFTFNFASYFNGRFTKLYNGIKEIGSKNYSQRLYFEGEDEFYDISLVFNEMAQDLNENTRSSKVNFKEEFEREISLNQTQELKRILEQMQGIEERAVDLIAKLENKENKNGIS
jgi:two-component system, NtrC family, sensor histidine kinase KinB